MKYKKVILKLSGETLSSPDLFGFDFKKVKQIAEEIKIFQQKKINLAIVIGAGNIFRARMLKEKEIYKEQLAKEGKPADIMEKILEGKVNKFYQEVCLVKQAFVKDDKKSIEKLLEENDAIIEKFTRYAL